MLPVADGGGGPARQPVTSDVTVDPGQIRQFARFLEEMSSEIDTIRQRVKDYTPQGSQKVDFGHYLTSAKADQEHRRTVAAGHTNLDRLHTRSDEIVEGTRLLANQYDDIEQLNRVTAGQVNSQLDRKA